MALTQSEAGQDGKHPDKVNGQDSRQPAPGSRTPQDPTPRTAQPHLILDSAASLAQFTPGDHASFAGQHHSRTTQGDQHEAAAHTHHQLSGEHFSLYAHHGQLQAKAAAGPMSIQAHTDALDILPVNTFKASAATNEEAIANIRRAEHEAEHFWAEQATSEQRETRAELNGDDGDDGRENAWHYLNESQQRSLRAKLMGDRA